MSIESVLFAVICVVAAIVVLLVIAGLARISRANDEDYFLRRIQQRTQPEVIEAPRKFHSNIRNMHSPQKVISIK